MRMQTTSLSSKIVSLDRSRSLKEGRRGLKVVVRATDARSRTFRAVGQASVLNLCVAAWPKVASAATSASAAGGALGWVKGATSFLLHLDVHLSAMIASYGAATYAILFAIVFCETGLVVTPFLPGDSLLFAAGAFAAMGSLNLGMLIGSLFVAAVLGDTVNYAIGAWLGKKALDSNLIKREYLEKTEKFYEKYGGKTVVLARFVPIVRTFAPFVAGLGSMYYSKFFFYNVLGGAIWTVLFTSAGYFFGNLPFVQHNFTLVVLAIIAISVVPVILEIYQASKETGQAGGLMSMEERVSDRRAWIQAWKDRTAPA